MNRKRYLFILNLSIVILVILTWKCWWFFRYHISFISFTMLFLNEIIKWRDIEKLRFRAVFWEKLWENLNYIPTKPLIMRPYFWRYIRFENKLPSNISNEIFSVQWFSHSIAKDEMTSDAIFAAFYYALGLWHMSISSWLCAMANIKSFCNTIESVEKENTCMENHTLRQQKS